MASKKIMNKMQQAAHQNKLERSRRNKRIEKLKTVGQNNSSYEHALLALRHQVQLAYSLVNKSMKATTDDARYNESVQSHKRTLKTIEYDIRSLIFECREYGINLSDEYQDLLEDKNNGRIFGHPDN